MIRTFSFHISRRFLGGLSLFALLGLGGCINLDPVVDPTRTFLLYAPGVDVEAFGDRSDKPSIYIDKVDIPPYLDDKRLVIRLSDQQVEYEEFIRWAEPLDQGIGRAIALNLVNLPGVEEVSFYPWKGVRSMDLVFQLKVFKFELQADGEVDFNGVLRIRRSGDSSEGLLQYPFEIRKPVEDDRPETIIQAMSDAIRDLTQSLAEQYGQNR